MSLYPNYYGQPSYANPPLPPAHNGFHHPYQQQQYQSIPPLPSTQSLPVYHVDPVTFRRDYASRLAELTVNSRPIIQNLSYIAQEYTRFANIVAECIEAHIRRVPPWMKLPAFYLLDAISKNLYDPYARHFSAFVTPLFLDTYQVVDLSTRSKMEEMLLTWRTASPTGKELFGVPPQVSIERGVWDTTGNTNSNLPPGSTITTPQVLRELEFTLSQKERALQNNPYDGVAQKHITVLHQLRNLVETGVSQDQLHLILSQLRTLLRNTPPQVAPPQPVIPQPAVWPPSYAPVASQAPAAPYPPPPVNAIPPSNPAPSSSAPSNIASLLSTLVKAGIVSANAPTPPPPTDEKVASPEHSEQKRIKSYRQAVLAIPVKLNSNDITRQRPPIVDLLYDRLTVQCKQCGIRFVDNDEGKKSMNNHLDMHFRQNRKANQNVGRGHSRSLFVAVEDWVHETIDIKGKGRADGTRPVNAKVAAAAEAAKREAELRALSVVVPLGEEAEMKACPICKEVLQSEFLEDVEDWVWRNAIMKDDKVYHATCHAEAVTSTSNLAARLRNEARGSRSRSGTPESRVTPPPTRVRPTDVKAPSLSPSQEAKTTGTKRKVDPDDLPLGHEHGGTPPLKKLALSPSA
ncbi:hypothetical protein BDN72DRAFT_831244 [Pluteus cervinus]|uniref:Uncharacterized protein n=1 Tax=Pluteus cervinus TaxID=181527 RepID=A0ACD3BCS0_9AGAR|nr:hypothetical protein BDN72DRAFT_831244 [Pluteus cervinus]